MTKTLTYLLGLAMLAAPVMAAERVGNTFVLDEIEAQLCARGQGCKVIHRDIAQREIEQIIEQTIQVAAQEATKMVHQAYEAGKTAGAKACGSV